MQNQNGNGGDNPNPKVGQGDTPKYAPVMFENFMKAYMQVQEQLSVIINCQNREGHSGTGGDEDGSSIGRNTGAEIVRGIHSKNSSTTFTPSVLKKPLNRGMPTNG